LSRYIQNLIDQGEHQQQDFKFEISDARKIARSLVAFSNTDGGKLLVGVKDNGRISGVRSEEEYHMLEAAAQMYCKPEVKLNIQKWTIRGKTILEVDIAEADKKPFMSMNDEKKWLAYVRVGDQNLLANSVMMKVWSTEKRKKGIRIDYRDTESILLNYLRNNSQITISGFCRIGKINRKKAEDILANLIVLEILRISITDIGTWYSLAPDQKATGDYFSNLDRRE
jgi:predicted HTH transcriptional regulator